MKIDINELAKVKGIGDKTIKRVKNTVIAQSNEKRDILFTPPKLPQNRLYCGRAEALLQHIPDNTIQLTVTSPPYDDLRSYEGFDFDYRVIARHLYRITKGGGVVVWVVDDTTSNFCESLVSFEQASFLLRRRGLTY